MVDIGVLLRSEVVGISSWGGVYYVQITISWQGGLRLYGFHSRPTADPLFIVNITYDYSHLT
jgi:hypothetical protein